MDPVLDAALPELFSRTVVLRGADNQITRIYGSSLLLRIVMSMEADREYLSKRGCIAKAKVNMIYASGDDNTGAYKSTQLTGDGRDVIADMTGLTADGGMTELRSEFQSCGGSVDFFLIPLNLVPMVDGPRHANAILVSKSKGTYFRIEPAYAKEDVSDTSNPRIYTGIENILNDIGATGFTRVELNATCPQFLTKDDNCLFWTSYLAREVIRKMYKNQDPNTTIAQVSRRGIPELQKEIQAFKREILKSTQSFLDKNQLTWRAFQERITATNRPVIGAPPVAGGMYWPLKYYRGLTRKQNLQRKKSATRRTKMSFKDPKAYAPFKSDKGVKTRKSSYTEKFHKKYPDAKSLSEIAKATGISKSILQEVYDRGMAAWRTGHRPGASQHAWGMARLHSFVMKGKTWRTADADLARKV